jgi:hypothetical protein
VGDYPIRQLILHPRILVGWFSWEFNPEVLGSLRLKASVMRRRAVPLFSSCPGIRLTTEEKHGKPQSGQPSGQGTARCANLAVFWGTASAGLLHVGSPLLPRWLQSALGRNRSTHGQNWYGKLHKILFRKFHLRVIFLVCINFYSYFWALWKIMIKVALVLFYHVKGLLRLIRCETLTT